MKPDSAHNRARQFASDNWAGVCPEAWDALLQANRDHVPSYGDDAYTQRAADLIRDFFETDCEVFFTFNGTASNSLALASLCQSYHSILCHDLAHIETDECGAPEFFSNGTKVLLIPGEAGILDLDAVKRAVHRRKDIHYPKPKVLSVTQATELGTVYSVDQLQHIGDVARELGLHVHMDGARFANAVAHLGVAPREITSDVGVDVLCLGGAKAGMPIGDAVVFFDKTLAAEFDYRCKQAGQLASKMRFLAAPWIGMLESGAYVRRAHYANTCARSLAEKLDVIPGVSIKYTPQANSVFIDMPSQIASGLKSRGWYFYTFIGEGGGRFMCSWDTQSADIDALISDFRSLA